MTHEEIKHLEVGDIVENEKGVRYGFSKLVGTLKKPYYVFHRGDFDQGIYWNMDYLINSLKVYTGSYRAK